MAEMDKVERVARALCGADRKDPDGLYSTDEIETVPWLGGGMIQQTKKDAVWKLYQGEARRFIAASEALAGTITGGG